MDREDNIYSKNLHDQVLRGLAVMCTNVSRNRAADNTQWDTAHALRIEWLRLNIGSDTSEAEASSLKKRMLEFLIGVPHWMLAGV
jgi:hypothetical protein